jgi:hypothetical protein
MKLVEQVCSLELAKRLKELGVKQESYFYWTTLEYYVHIPGVQEGPTPCVMPGFEVDGRNKLSAFTVAELGEILPITIYGDFDHLICDKAIKHWFVYYSRDREGSLRSKSGLHLHTADTFLLGEEEH